MGTPVSESVTTPAIAAKSGEGCSARHHSRSSVSLDGWSLNNSSGLTFDLSGTIAAGERREFKLVCSRPFLRNTGDEISLIRRDGSKASFVEYKAESVVEGEYVYFEDDGG